MPNFLICMKHSKTISKLVFAKFPHFLYRANLPALDSLIERFFWLLPKIEKRRDHPGINTLYTTLKLIRLLQFTCSIPRGETLLDLLFNSYFLLLETSYLFSASRIQTFSSNLQRTKEHEVQQYPQLQ